MKMDNSLTELLSLSLPKMELIGTHALERLVEDLLGDSTPSIPDVCASRSSVNTSPVGYSAASPFPSPVQGSSGCNLALPFPSPVPGSSGCNLTLHQFPLYGPASPASIYKLGSPNFSHSPPSTPGSWRLASPNLSPKSHISILSSPSPTLLSAPVSSSASSSFRGSRHRYTPYPRMTARYSPISDASNRAESPETECIPESGKTIGRQLYSPISDASNRAESPETECIPESGKTIRRQLFQSLAVRYQDFETMIRPKDDGELVPYYILEPYLNMNFDLVDETSDWD